ncbi:hypothetical protein MMC19_001964 [Ptychographa xylographoides]|nr:hypothetical protein [Ptychographa xylographoides]
MCKRKFTDVSENTASQLRVTRQRLVSITEPQRRLIDTRQLSHRLPNELWEEIYLAALLDDNYVNVVDIFFADEAFTQILSTQRVYHALVLKSLHQGPRCLEMDTETHNRNNNDRLAERTTMEADYNESVTILLNQSWFTMSLYKKAMTKYFSNIVIGAYQEWTKEHNLPVSNQQEELLRELISSGYALLRPTKTSMESSVRHRIHDPISEQIIHFRLIAGKSLLTIQSWKIKKSRSDRTRHDTYINRPRTARGVPLPPRVFSGDFNAEDLFFLQLLVSRGCTVSKRPTDAFLANIAVENAIRAHNLPAIRVLLGPMNTRHATPISPPTFFYTADWHVPLPEVLDSQKERFCFDKLTAAARAGTPFATIDVYTSVLAMEGT